MRVKKKHKHASAAEPAAKGHDARVPDALQAPTAKHSLPLRMPYLMLQLNKSYGRLARRPFDIEMPRGGLQGAPQSV